MLNKNDKENKWCKAVLHCKKFSPKKNRERLRAGIWFSLFRFAAKHERFLAYPIIVLLMKNIWDPWDFLNVDERSLVQVRRASCSRSALQPLQYLQHQGQKPPLHAWPDHDCPQQQQPLGLHSSHFPRPDSYDAINFLFHCCLQLPMTEDHFHTISHWQKTICLAFLTGEAHLHVPWFILVLNKIFHSRYKRSPWSAAMKDRLIIAEEF